MPTADTDTLIVPALSALAASAEGTMTMTQLIAILETRQGSTAEGAGDARSLESRTFEARVRALVGNGTADGLVTRGLVGVEAEGTVLRITPAGREAIGRR